jgi:hypothetical protein
LPSPPGFDPSVEAQVIHVRVDPDLRRVTNSYDVSLQKLCLYILDIHALFTCLVQV